MRFAATDAFCVFGEDVVRCLFLSVPRSLGGRRSLTVLSSVLFVLLDHARTHCAILDKWNLRSARVVLCRALRLSQRSAIPWNRIGGSSVEEALSTQCAVTLRSSKRVHKQRIGGCSGASRGARDVRTPWRHAVGCLDRSRRTFVRVQDRRRMSTLRIEGMREDADGDERNPVEESRFGDDACAEGASPFCCWRGSTG